jgi:hypothetical protein
MQLPIPFWLILMLALLVSVLAFTGVYSALPDGSFHLEHEPTRVRAIDFSEAAFVSVSTQTLLGLGVGTPVTRTARALVMVQATISFVLLMLAASRTIQTDLVSSSSLSLE